MIGYRGLIVNIVSLLLSDYIMIAELLGLWIMLGSNVHLKRRTIKTTRVVIILIFTEALLSAIERWTRGLDHLTYARIILTPTVYLLHPIIMLGIMDMAEFVKKHRALLYLPVLISAPLLYSSQWTHLVYWFSPDNVYHSADSVLRYYPYFFFLLYIILFVGAFTVQYIRHGTDERKGILVSIIVAAAGLILHFILKVEVDYSTLFASLLLIYYLSLYVLTAKEP